MEVSLEQLRNAYSPSWVTLSGIVIEVRSEHPENAYHPISVMLSGILIEASPSQPENAICAILVIPFGIVTEKESVLSFLLQSSSISLTITKSLFLQRLSNHAVPPNVSRSKQVTFLGILTEVRFEHP